jgi:hypothetical protein
MEVTPTPRRSRCIEQQKPLPSMVKRAIQARRYSDAAAPAEGAASLAQDEHEYESASEEQRTMEVTPVSRRTRDCGPGRRCPPRFGRPSSRAARVPPRPLLAAWWRGAGYEYTDGDGGAFEEQRAMDDHPLHLPRAPRPVTDSVDGASGRGDGARALVIRGGRGDGGPGARGRGARSDGRDGGRARAAPAVDPGGAGRAGQHRDQLP